MSESIPSQDSVRAAQLIERLGRVLRADDHAGGLNPAQWEALRYLARSNRFSRTPAALSAYLGATRGTVSQTVIALEAKGLVVKEPDPRDGRGVRLSLTPAGVARLDGDAIHTLALAIDASGGPRLATELERVLRTVIRDRGGRAFGACRTCRHFRAGVRRGAAPNTCALLDEPLSEADAGQICVEQSAA